MYSCALKCLLSVHIAYTVTWELQYIPQTSVIKLSKDLSHYDNHGITSIVVANTLILNTGATTQTTSIILWAGNVVKMDMLCALHTDFLSDEIVST